MREIKIGKLYKHFKGNIYKVIDIVNDCETPKGEPLKKIVIYQAEYGEKLKWARAYESFTSLVDHEKYPAVKQEYKFEEYNQEIKV